MDSDSEPWLCRAPSDIVEGLFGASGLLKGQVDTLRLQFMRSSLRVTDGKAMMPIEMSWETLRNVCSLMCGNNVMPHFSPEMVASFPNMAKSCKPTLFALAAGFQQPPRFESGGLGKLRLSCCGARRVWLINGPRFCESALGKRNAPATDLQAKLTSLTREEIAKLARADGKLFQWVQVL